MTRTASFRLTLAQRMDLILGGSAFPDEATRRAAWDAYRDRIRINPGCRPRAWWDYDAPPALRRRREAGEDAKVLLYEAGLLEPEERLLVAGLWRRDEQRAFDGAVWVAGHSGVEAGRRSYADDVAHVATAFRRKLTAAALTLGLPN